MTKREKIRAVSFLAAVLLTLCGLWANSQSILNTAQTQLEYSYRRALNDLTDYVSGMRSALEKAPYVNTALMQSQVSAQLLEQSGGAKAALAVLPLSSDKSDKLSRFLSQTGDYALFLARNSAAGLPQSEDRQKSLSVLAEYAGKLSEALQNAQARLNVENVSIGQVKSAWNNVEELDALPVLDDDFDQVAEAFSQFPALLYDGPFSDHIQRREPLYLQGMPELLKDEAAEKAAEFLGCQPRDLSYLGEGGGQLPVYSFIYDDSHINITRQGGEIAYFKKAGKIQTAALTGPEALERAAQALRGMTDIPCRESYYVLSDNLCTVNFAASVSLDGAEVLCYPDLIKVTVEMHEGGMVEYDATGFLMNHRERTLSAPSLTAAEAAQNLSPLLTWDSASLALIPTPGLDEVLCWEFHCRGNDDPEKEFLVYLNGETGQEEQLYQLLRNEHGVLAN